VEQTIANIENSNFVVRYFNKGSLDMLKKQQQYIKVMIEKEKAFVEYRRLQ
jgi:intein-encoded DNA endonuclease-like protein